MKLNQHVFFALLGLLAVFSTGTTQASITTYTNRAAFISQLQPGYYEDTFAGVTTGSIQGTSTTRSGNGYSVTYTAPPDGLYSIQAGLSTNTGLENLIASLSVNSYAVGGYFYLTDSTSQYQPFPGVNISAIAANGIDPNSTLLAANSATNFFGWISTTPITTVTVTNSSSSGSFNTVTDVFVGGKASSSPVPEPGSLSLLLLGSAIAFAKRRKAPKSQ